MHIEQVETLLKTQDPAVVTPEAAPASFANGQTNVSGVGLRSVPATDFSVLDPAIVGVGGVNAERWGYNGESPQQPMEPFGFPSDNMTGMGIDDNTFTWEMIGLGLEEPLPPQETIDELYVILFTRFRTCSLSIIQTSDLFRQNPSLSSHDPQVSISRGDEPVSLRLS